MEAVTRMTLGPIMEEAKAMACEVAVCSGGFPCQDVSMLSKFRAGADGARSGLFKEFVRVSRLVMELATEYELHFMGLGECTVMDVHDKVKITEGIGWDVLQMCSSGSSCVKKPTTLLSVRRVSIVNCEAMRVVDCGSFTGHVYFVGSTLFVRIHRRLNQVLKAMCLVFLRMNLQET